MGDCLVRENNRNGGVGRWGWCEEGVVVDMGGVCVGGGRCGCDVGGCGRWVQVMECVKIEVWRGWVYGRGLVHILTLVCYIDQPIVLYTVLVKFRGRLQWVFCSLCHGP